VELIKQSLHMDRLHQERPLPWEDRICKTKMVLDLFLWASRKSSSKLKLRILTETSKLQSHSLRFITRRLMI
jgi:hypothetical protein